jgi:hypothetical protein
MISDGKMNAGTKLAALNKFRSSGLVMMRQPVTKVLVINDFKSKSQSILVNGTQQRWYGCSHPVCLLDRR